MGIFKKITALTMVCTALCATFIMQPAFANDDAVKNHVLKVADKVIETITKVGDDFTKRQAEFKQIFADYADTKAIAMFTAGRAFTLADQVDKDAFVSAFQDYMAYTYAKRITGYGGETVSVLRVQNMGEKGYVVRTRLNRTNDTPPITIDWQLRSASQNYKILDLRIEEISMSQTQRSEFQSILQRNDMKLSKLVSVLKERM